MPNSSSQRPIALVTGATVGIGAAFAELLARESHDLVIVARDVARLNSRAEEWRSRYNIEVEVIQADLSRDEDIRRLELRLQNISRPIEILINNAGFGINKSFTASDIAEEIALLDVLVTAPMRLMHAVLPRMKERNSGTIINVSSVAGWIAGGTYSAAKSYLTVLSESLHTELRDTNVNVHALCPGFTRTEFHQRGRMKMGAVPNSFWLTAEQVVSDAWKAAKAGKAISVPGGQYKILSFITRFAPRPLVRKVGMNVRVRQRK
ncbi:MAG: SDR family NAD(P)-dependent oxidoreductase [Actinomycetota bacterium]